MTTTYKIMQPFFDDVSASPFRIAPEREEEMAARLAEAGVETLDLVDGAARFVAMPGCDAHIRVSAAALASLWCLAFVAFSFMDVASRAAASRAGQKADQLLVYAAPTYRELLCFARRLYLADEAWPDDLPRPEFGSDPTTKSGRINNLFLAATSWVLLHEIGHMTLGHSRLVSESLRLNQEEQADKFAVLWSLERCPAADHREFRVLAIIVALAWLFLFEQTSWGGGDHPRSIMRFWQAASLFEVPDDSPALENGVYALKAIFDAEAADMPSDLAPREAFTWIDDRLAKLFPRT
ncbi:MAG: hypothetical protein IM662_09495 [Phenylobacterium sp.]|nr:hypothetical protein [Phenylobacterium sp.]MCA6292852.1 hypothetical protein [Phenylobacterium sp.]